MSEKKKASQKDYKINSHQLYTARPSVWWKLVAENNIDRGNQWMAAKIFFYTTLTAPLQWTQRLIFGSRIKKIRFKEKPPIFILGHWRSGTTHLFYLMGRDKRFGYLNNYQSYMYNIALVGGKLLKAIIQKLTPKSRGVDNMYMDAETPQEEEQNLTNIGTNTNLHSFYFPRNGTYFQKYALFEGLSKEEKIGWQRDYMEVLQNISYYNNEKRLVVKNPNNTGRVKELLELFPNAKFIHIHRNPYDVFPSTCRLYDKIISTQFLQNVDDDFTPNRVLYNYKTIMKKYLDERHLIPKENLIEIAYDDLDKRPIETMKSIYQALDLGGEEGAMPEMQKYLDGLKDYKKNRFQNLPPDILEKIHSDWKFAFDEWDYPMEHIAPEPNLDTI